MAMSRKPKIPFGMKNPPRSAMHAILGNESQLSTDGRTASYLADRRIQLNEEDGFSNHDDDPWGISAIVIVYPGRMVAPAWAIYGAFGITFLDSRSLEIILRTRWESVIRLDNRIYLDVHYGGFVTTGFCYYDGSLPIEVRAKENQKLSAAELTGFYFYHGGQSMLSTFASAFSEKMLAGRHADVPLLIRG